MTMEDALAELDRRFEEYLAGEVEQMRGLSFGQALIDAVVSENQRRYAELRETAAAKAIGSLH